MTGVLLGFIGFSAIIFGATRIGPNRSRELSTQDFLVKKPAVILDDALHFNYSLAPFFEREHQVVQVKLPVQNIQKFPVQFLEVRPLCGACTHAKLCKTYLEPGESTELNVTLNLNHREGFQRSAVILKDQLGREWTCNYEYDIIPRHRFSGNYNIHLLNVEPTQVLSKRLCFDVFSKDLVSLPEDIDFELAGGFHISEFESVMLQHSDGVYIKRFSFSLQIIVPDKPGPFHDVLKVKYIYRGQKEKALLHIAGNVKRLISVVPDTLYFSPGCEAKKVIIKRSDSKPLLLEHTDSSVSMVTAIEPTKDHAACILYIQPQRDYDDPAFLEIILKTNHEKQSVISIPVTILPGSKKPNKQHKGESHDERKVNASGDWMLIDIARCRDNIGL